nr:hypothetical protein [uncultured Allomuricauda sp.]
MKKILVLLCLSIFQFVQSQERFLEITNDLKDGNRNVHTAFSVVDEETGNFAIFLDDDNQMYGFLFTPSLQLIRRFATEGLPKKYNQIIGYSILDQKIRLFLKDKKDKTFGSVLFDFQRGSIHETLYDFKLKQEFFVEGYSNGSKFHLITMPKNSSLFHDYIFEEGKEYVQRTIDLSNETFTDDIGATESLNTIMSTGGNIHSVGSQYRFQVDKIDPESPNSIESTSKVVKMYPGKSGFKLTVDTQRHAYLIDVNTQDLDYSLSTIEKPYLSTPSANSNSFVLNNKIYLISSTIDEMVFSVKSLDTREELKNIHISKDDDITFKNTPIIQEGGTYKNYREMEKTSKFLRRLANEDIGVVASMYNNHYIITMGSKKEISRGGAPMMMPGFGFASAGPFMVTFNPTFFAYGNYTSTKATRIECLFDENFNHKEGNIPQNIFDKIKDAAEKFPKKNAETVFRLNNDYIWGFYNKKLDKYIMYKF